MASVKLTNVQKVYDNKVIAVNDFNLEIKDKEFVVFVGPSGCGKSTTLRMIAGLEDISGGTIEIDGEVVNDLQPKDRNIAMVFQNYALYPHMTVYDNIAFSLRLKKLPEDEVYARVTNAAEILGISEYLLRKPRALSGGQRQRVAIGRAMVRDSKVFLMDEPLSNLDAKLRNQMRAEIILLRQKLDTTFVYVTHDQTEAMTRGDRIVIMKDGFIQQVGTPEEVFERPGNLFVAEFIGAPKMNIMRTQLLLEDGKYYVTPFGAKIEVDGVNGELLKEKGVEAGEIILGIRPEHIELAEHDGAEVVKGQVLVNEMMGSEIYLHVNAGGKDVVVRGPTTDLPAEYRAGIPYGTKIIARTPTLELSHEDRKQLKNGFPVQLIFPAKALYFFDPETEKNLIYG